jgi:hypothetical protein
MAESIVAVLALAFLAESLTEYLFSVPLNSLRLPSRLLRYVAVGVGVLLAWAYDLDITRDLLELTPRPPILGVVLTGVILGRGASYVHDFYGSYLRPGRPVEGRSGIAAAAEGVAPSAETEEGGQ